MHVGKTLLIQVKIMCRLEKNQRKQVLRLECSTWNVDLEWTLIEHKHSMSIGVDILFATEICIILSSCFAKQLYFSYILYYTVHITIYSIEVNIIMHQLALHIRTTSMIYTKEKNILQFDALSIKKLHCGLIMSIYKSTWLKVNIPCTKYNLKWPQL